MRTSFCVISSLMFVLIWLSGCKSVKNIAYFQNVTDSIYTKGLTLPTTKFSDPRIQANDIVQISIVTLDPAVNTLLNTESTSAFSVQPGFSSIQTPPAQVTGFLIDKEGFAHLPVIGKVKLAGLTTGEARDSIFTRVSQYYKDPVVNVRFANFSVTILGEVARPATYVVPNEKISILDAIGLAGDLTIYGKRENVLIVRDTVNGQKVLARFDLNSSKTFQSPYFYLKQGDVVYVEPNKSKIESVDAPRRNSVYAMFVALASLMITIISRIN